MYFMSTVCGHPQGEWGVRPMWTHVDRGRGVKKRDFFVDVINGWPLMVFFGVAQMIESQRDSVVYTQDRCLTFNIGLI